MPLQYPYAVHSQYPVNTPYSMNAQYSANAAYSMPNMYKMAAAQQGKSIQISLIYSFLKEPR